MPSTLPGGWGRVNDDDHVAHVAHVSTDSSRIAEQLKTRSYVVHVSIHNLIDQYNLVAANLHLSSLTIITYRNL